MRSKSRSKSDSRKISKTSNRIVAKPLEEILPTSHEKPDNFQTTINKTGYLADISSAAVMSTINKPSNNPNFQTVENGLEHKSVTDITKNSETMTDWNSSVFIKKPLNVIDRKYQSYCIDDTANGTFLFNNTESMIAPDIKQTLESRKKESVKYDQLFDSSSDEETFKVPKSKPFVSRLKSRSFRKESSKDENIKSETKNCKKESSTLVESKKISENVGELNDKMNSAISAPTTTLGLYSEFKNEYEKLLTGCEVLGEVSLSDNGKTKIPLPEERNYTKTKKTGKVQPSPIPKEECLEISEIDSADFKKLHSVEKKNTSSRYNRLTLAQQLEKTFIENEILLNLNNQKLPITMDQLNHTYRNSLEETLPNFNFKCLANSTCKEDTIEKSVNDEMTTQNIQTPYLSRNFVKNLGYASVVSETERNNTSFMKKHFSIVNDCTTEMVRQNSNLKTTTVITTPNIISDIGIKKSEFINDANAITTTNTRDILSTNVDNETNTLKSTTVDETITKSTSQLDESKNTTIIKETENSIVKSEKTLQMESKPFIDSTIIDDFRDEMIQSVNDVCDFLTQKVKNDTAVNLVEERFMENARFLYKFFFHSCRENN